jgi:hypothetical protein
MVHATNPTTMPRMAPGNPNKQRKNSGSPHCFDSLEPPLPENAKHRKNSAIRLPPSKYRSGIRKPAKAQNPTTRNVLISLRGLFMLQTKHFSDCQANRLNARGDRLNQCGKPWPDQSKALSSIGLSASNASETGLWLAFGACFLSCIDQR